MGRIWHVSGYIASTHYSHLPQCLISLFAPINCWLMSQLELNIKCMPSQRTKCIIRGIGRIGMREGESKLALLKILYMDIVHHCQGKCQSGWVSWSMLLQIDYFHGPKWCLFAIPEDFFLCLLWWTLKDILATCSTSFYYWHIIYVPKIHYLVH